MRIGTSKAICLGLLGLLGVLRSPVHAGVSELTVNGTFDGQPLYVVAYVSEKGNSSSQPGLYVLQRGKEAPQALLKGAILGAGRSFNGILSQLELSRSTQRNESLAVLDGKLVLFTKHSRANKKSSYIVLGSADHPVRDVMNLRPVPIAPITRIDDVAVANGARTIHSQVVLISVRQPSPFGGGLTMAMLVKRQSSDGLVSELELEGPPVVIDYSFYSAKDLTQLLSSEDTTAVISPSHLLQLREPQPWDDRIMDRWRAHLSGFVKRIRKDRDAKAEAKDKKNKMVAGTIPRYSLEEQQLIFDRLPYELLLERPLEVFQRINPTGGEGSGVVVRQDRDGSEEDEELDPRTLPLIPGKVEYDEIRKAYRIYPVESQTNQPMAVAVVDNRTYLIALHQSEPVKVDLTAVMPREVRHLQLVHTKVGVGKNDNHFKNFLIMSVTETEGKSRTDALVLDERDGVYRYERRLGLNHRYMTAKELSRRTFVHTPKPRQEMGRESDGGDEEAEVEDPEIAEEDNETAAPRGSVLFDNLTSSEQVLSGRYRRDTLTSPLFNLSQTMKPEEWRQTYLRSLEDVALIENEIILRKFEALGARVSQSGFYIQDIPRDLSSKVVFVPGEVIRIGNDKKAPYYLDQVTTREATLADKSKSPEFRVATYAFNPEPGKKIPENRFSALLYVALAHGATSIPAFHVALDIPSDVSRLVGAKIIQGRRQRGLNVTVLFFFRDQGRKAQRGDRGGVYAVNFEISPSIAISPNQRVHHLHQGWVERETVRPDQIKHRLVWDRLGDPYWILTPDVSREDRHYKVHRLSGAVEEAAVYANQPGARVFLRFDEPAEETDFDNLLRMQSRWILFNRLDIEQRFSWFRKYMDQFEEKKKKNPDRRLKDNILFPHFQGFLNSRAEVAPKVVHEVLVVEEGQKSLLLKAMLRKLVIDKEGSWSLAKQGFTAYVLDPKVTDKELRRELGKITAQGSGQNLLLADLGEMLEIQGIEVKRREFPTPKEESETGDEKKEKKDSGASMEEKAGGDAANENAPKGSFASASIEEIADEEDPLSRDDDFKSSMMMVLSTEGDRIPKRQYKSRTQVPHKIPMLIVATPSEWKALNEHYQDEKELGVFDTFHLNTQFLTSSWSVWGPETGKASDEVKKAARAPISADEYGVFPNLEKLLTDLASKDKPAEHRFLVVPEELKALVRRLIMARWATDLKSLTGPWNRSNSDLALFSLSQDHLSQELVSENFEAMRGALRGRRPVLLADMQDILKIGRLRSEDGENGGFLLKDPVGEKAGQTELGRETEDNGDARPLSQQLPHMIWWLATEGRQVQPKATKGWQLKQEARPEIPTLILTTEKELDALHQEAKFEHKFIDFKEQFALTHMQKPSEEAKAVLIEDLFRRRDIASLQYEFKHENLDAEDARKQLVGLLVGKVEQISQLLRIESTYAFLKIYVALRRALIEDPELRQDRAIDSAYIFRLFAKVFPLPLSYEILTPTDPLIKLKDPEAAARGIQERGYEGPLDLKRQVVRNLTGHTRGGGDGGRKIPSSIVLIGDTGTGKTFLVETLIRYMGLKLYSYSKPYDDDAEAMIIRVMDLIEEDDPARPEKMSVKRVLEHASNFLASRNGWRGLLLFDDLHKATTPKILGQLMAFIQGLQEAQNGIVQVRRMAPDGKGEPKEIPVRNLMLTLTLNPTKDRKKRERFIDRHDKKNPVLEAVAALTMDGYQVDDTFFARFADVIDMSQFPREAKVPALLSQMREANQQEFSANPRLVLVTPQTLEALAHEFQKANARDFITPATSALLSLSSELRRAPLYLVDPQSMEWSAGVFSDLGFGDDPDENMEGPRVSKLQPGEIEKALRRTTVVHPVTMEDPVSKLHLLSFMADNFRGLIYNSLVLGSQASPLTSTHETRSTSMVSFLAAVLGNLTKFRRLPISQVDIRPADFGITDFDSIQSLQGAIAQHSSNEFKPHIEVPSGANFTDMRIDLNSFLGQTVSAAPERRRLDVMTETSADIQRVLEPALAKLFRVSSLQQLHDPVAWIKALDGTEPKETFKQVSQELIRIYIRFSAALYDKELIEVRHREDIAQMQLYDEVRLFLLCLDRAITQLPWSYVTQFTLDALTRSTKDLALGQKTGLQHFLFKSTYSPLTTVTPDSIVTSARGISVMRDVTEQKLDGWHSYFQNNCERFLTK